MFDAMCPGHGGRTILSVRAIEGVDHPEPGVIELHMRCWCGQRVVTRTGRGAAARV